MEIRTVLVVGMGAMGRGIAQVCAQAGYRTLVHDSSPEALGRSIESIRKSVRKRTERGEWGLEKEKGILAILRISDFSPGDLGEADIVIEAVTEDPSLKTAIFRRLDEHCREEALLGSNTSSIPITLIGSATKRPERVVGIHFMNPVPTMKGVEIIRGRVSSDQAMELSRVFVESLGKIPVEAKDYAGFITSRILNAYLNEAAFSVMDGNRPEDVDAAAVHCLNMPMGPCRLLDMVGIDVEVYVLGVLQEAFGEKFRAAPILKQMVHAGHLGVKSGRGFYAYDVPGKR